MYGNGNGNGNGHPMGRVVGKYRSALSRRSQSDGASQGPNSSYNLSKHAVSPPPYCNPDTRAMLAKRCEKSDQGNPNGLSLVSWPSSGVSSRSQWSHDPTITTVGVYPRGCVINHGRLATFSELYSIKVARKLADVLKQLYIKKNGPKRVYAPLVDRIIPSAWSHQNQSGFSIKQVIDSLEILLRPDTTTSKYIEHGDIEYAKDIVLFALSSIAAMPPITETDIKDTKIFDEFKTAQQELKRLIFDYLETNYLKNVRIRITNPMTDQPETIDIDKVKKNCAEQGRFEGLLLSQASALEKDQEAYYLRLNGSSNTADERPHRLNCPRITANQTLIDTQIRLQYRAEQNKVALAHERRLLTLPSSSSSFMASTPEIGSSGSSCLSGHGSPQSGDRGLYDTRSPD